MLKDNQEMDVVRSHDYAHFYGKLFVQFIGLILRNEITQRTTDLRNKTKDKKKYTTSNIIREFSCLNAVKFTDGLYVDTNSLNSDQKEVLKALDISQNTLKKYLNLFNKSF